MRAPGVFVAHHLESIMRQSSSSIAATLLAALLSCGAVAAAQAQSAPLGTPAPRMEHRAARFAEHRAAMETRLHDTLKLSATQESAWQKFTGAMKPSATPAMSRESLTGLTAPERADKMVEMSRQHQAAVEQRATALKEFYAVLNPEQKRAFDAFHAGMRHIGGHGGMPGHGAPGRAGAPL